MVRLIPLALGLLSLAVPGLARQSLPSNVRWHDPSTHRVRMVTVDSSVRLEVLDWGGSGRDHGVAFPEAELRQLFAANPDGSVGRSLLSPAIRKAIVDDNSSVKPQYGSIRVPVLAIFRTALPFDAVERESPPRNEDERTALRAKYAFGRAMVSRWEHDLLAGVPSARIVELPGANLYMFLSNEDEVLHEVQAFASTVRR